MNCADARRTNLLVLGLALGPEELLLQQVLLHLLNVTDLLGVALEGGHDESGSRKVHFGSRFDKLTVRILVRLLLAGVESVVWWASRLLMSFS